MNTKHFDYIITIAETKNISKASRQLGISQPVLSRYLTNLELQLDTKLFIQRNRSLHITETGQIYLNGVRRMKELQTQMFRSFEKLQGHKELLLKIGMSPFHGGRELAAFYPNLLEKYPNLNLLVEEGNAWELLEKLHRQELSAILNLYDAKLMPNTKIATLTKAEILIVLPNYHPLAISFDPGTITTLTISQLCSLNDIPFVYADEQTIVGKLIDQTCQRYQFSPQTLLRTSNSIAIKQLLLSGNYAGFLAENAVPQTTDLMVFRFPHPLYLYSGLIFNSDHLPNELEQFLYYLEYQQSKISTPDILYINDLGKRFLNSHNIQGRNL